MSVIIKDMKMPPSCYFCSLADASFIRCEAFSPTKLLEDDFEERRPKWCPLVELPSHGRLIDVDYLKEHLCQCEINGRPLHRMFTEIDELFDVIDIVPTVIEIEVE